MHKISIANDFSPYPTGRYLEDGPFNGTKFRERQLVPLLRSGEQVVVDIDGVALLPSSFWEEIWGGLIRTSGFTEDALREKVKIVTSDPELIQYPKIAWDMVHDEEMLSKKLRAD